ncbi:MAG: aspartate 1-decarboxylase [Elusimicrobiota bacterium]
MMREMLKSKIDRVKITGADIHYKGSLGLDIDFLKAADLKPGEKVHVLNLNNGERLETYVIEEPKGSKNVVLYGPAARKGIVGDTITILSYGFFNDSEIDGYKPKVVSVS